MSQHKGKCRPMARAAMGEPARVASSSTYSVPPPPELVKWTVDNEIASARKAAAEERRLAEQHFARADWWLALSRLIDQALTIEDRKRDELIAARRIRSCLEDLAMGEGSDG